MEMQALMLDHVRVLQQNKISALIIMQEDGMKFGEILQSLMNSVVAAQLLHIQTNKYHYKSNKSIILLAFIILGNQS